MKLKRTALFFVLLILLSGQDFCLAEGNSTDDYFQKVSLFSPVTYRSSRDAIHSRYAIPAAPSAFDPFPYIPHGKLEVPMGARVMVFVPHPDDEALSCSGLIQRVIQRHGKVRIVFITNGDGYVEAIRLKLQKNARITPKDFVEYGKTRQEEAIQAACEMGLQADDVTFLGFPDDGIDDLWESYWSKLKPFVSPHTLFDRPHRKGLNRWVKYSGIDLRQEMARMIADFMPEWLVLPDPRDLHPDHATAGVFVLDAFRDLYQKDDEGQPNRVLTYLVHFRDFPHGPEWAKTICATGVGGCPVSGKTLADTSWVSLQLTPEEVEGKRRALLAHNSQIQILGGFFKAFLLPCEMFGSLNIGQVIAVPQEYAAYHKHPAASGKPAKSVGH